MEYAEFGFNIVDVLNTLGIDHKKGTGDEDIVCPACGRKKLNICYGKNVYRCNACEEQGGMLDLFCLFQPSFSKQDAIREIESKTVHSYTYCAHTQYKNEPDETPLADVAIRDETYRAFLSLISLSEPHRKDLLRRGLTEDEIAKNLYKSVPLLGEKKIVQKLRNKGIQLTGVPGFYKDNGEWTFAPAEGYFVPVRDCEGRIQGMQIRNDNDVNRKYMWFTSKGKECGTKARTFVHSIMRDTQTVILTEGPLKADIISFLGNASVIAVPGVNSLGHLPEVLAQFREQGCYNVLLAYDMDWVSNPNVSKGKRNIKKLIEEQGMQCEDILWDPFYKGYDDFLLHLKNSK